MQTVERHEVLPLLVQQLIDAKSELRRLEVTDNLIINVSSLSYVVCANSLFNPTDGVQCRHKPHENNTRYSNQV